MKALFKSFPRKSRLLIVLCFIAGCSKHLEVAPPFSSISSQNVFMSEASATAALTYILSEMSVGRGILFGFEESAPPISIRLGLAADEFRLFSTVSSANLLGYYRNALDATSAGNLSFWNNAYTILYYCNAAIEGLSNSNIPLSTKNQLIGEAKFIRAYYHFTMVNCYGDIPLVLSTNVEQNAKISRSPVSQVYNQAIDDLKEASDLLNGNFLDGKLQVENIERVRPTRWAALALLARVYLYAGDYAKAEETATSVISQSSIFSLSPVSDVFLRAGLGNKEAIFQIQPTIVNWNTCDARMLIVNGPTGNAKPVFASTELLGAFEGGDLRRVAWLRDTTIGGSSITYINKYKSAILNAPLTEYQMLLRLPEQYLIRSEARAKLNNLSGAVSDLNLIRQRSRATPTTSVPNPLPALSANLTQAQVLDRVAQERRIELFAEMGHRWFDLKRTGKIDQIMPAACTAKGSSWNGFQQLFPIPLQEMQRNIYLIQNPGY